MWTDIEGPEFKNQGMVFLTKQKSHTVSQLTKVTSDWWKMKSIMALVIFFIRETQNMS